MFLLGQPQKKRKIYELKKTSNTATSTQQHKQIESDTRISLIQSPVDSKQIEEKQDCRERKRVYI
jgi:hypothetical protein